MFIKRSAYLNKLEIYTGKDVVKILTGVRRCGKTTLFHTLIEEMKAGGIPEENIIYLNFESLVYAYFTKAEELKNMTEVFLRQTSGHSYVFLDEIQNIENWGKVLKELMASHDCEFFVSASNASIFYEGFAADLDYKYVRIEMYPISFGEYCQSFADDPENEGLDRNGLFLKYLEKGSMPASYGSDASVAGDIYSAILLKDVIQPGKIRDTDHIDRIMHYIFTHMGEAFSPKKLRDSIREQGVTISVDTVYSCLDALVSAFLIYRVPRYDVKAGRELETQEKYYICDISMRKAVMGDEEMPLEAALENAVCMGLLSEGFRLFTARSGSSLVDFMGTKGDERLYINCCESVQGNEAVRREFGPLTRISDNYYKIVLSMDPETIVNKGGIINYPLPSYLMQE